MQDKKKQTRIATILQGVSFLFLLFSLFCPLFDAVSFVENNKIATYSNGFSFLFGTKANFGRKILTLQGPNIQGLIAYILLALSLIALFLGFFLSRKKKKAGSLLALAGCLTLFVSSVLFFTISNSLVEQIALAKRITTASKIETLKSGFQLGTTFILLDLFPPLSFLLSLISGYLDDTWDRCKLIFLGGK